MTVRNYPESPVFVSLVKKYGYSKFSKKFLDKEGNAKENAPEGLKEEMKAMKKCRGVGYEPKFRLARRAKQRKTFQLINTIGRKQNDN